VGQGHEWMRELRIQCGWTILNRHFDYFQKIMSEKVPNETMGSSKKKSATINAVLSYISRKANIHLGQ
jgi:hypothetical protein